jgi:hypothetical protein
MAVNPVLAAFQLQLDGTNPITLLLTAEAAGRAVDQSTAANAAAVAVATSLGYAPSNYDSSTGPALISMALTKLASLQYLCQGPSKAVPNGNYYSWSLA